MDLCHCCLLHNGPLSPCSVPLFFTFTWPKEYVSFAMLNKCKNLATFSAHLDQLFAQDRENLETTFGKRLQHPKT